MSQMLIGLLVLLAICSPALIGLVMLSWYYNKPHIKRRDTEVSLLKRKQKLRTLQEEMERSQRRSQRDGLEVRILELKHEIQWLEDKLQSVSTATVPNIEEEEYENEVDPDEANA